MFKSLGDSEPYLRRAGRGVPSAPRWTCDRLTGTFLAISASMLLLAGNLPARGQPDPVYEWATLAGPFGGAGHEDGTSAHARFNHPSGVAVDTAGNLYAADTWNNRIAKATFPSPYPTVAWGFDGTRLRLAWPERFLGWELQAQTNSLSVGLGTNWFPVPDSKPATQLTITVDSVTPSVAYRLRSP